MFNTFNAEPVDAVGVWPAKKRGAVACERCHGRKIRCDYSHRGPPCHNCRVDGLNCRVFQGKHVGSRTHRPQAQPKRCPRQRHPRRSVLRIVRADDDEDTRTENAPILSPDVLMYMGGDESVVTEHRGCYTGAVPISTSEHGSTESTPRDFNGDNQQGEVTGAEVNLPAFKVAFGDEVGTDAVPFFVGEVHGLDFMLDLCRPNRTRSHHYPVPRRENRSLSGEGLSYLRAKQVFSLPSDDLCRELIRCYFFYVHPMLPIVDAASFLIDFSEKGLSKMSLLLLWSMFFLASGYLCKEYVEASGFPHNRALKHSMYCKAKALYDMDYEPDKLRLIQSVLLMSSWYADTEDRTGPCHWVGVAIGLCQTIGLHRDVGSESLARNTFSAAQRGLWQRIWWSCYYREVWNGLAFGRPSRIDLTQCNTALPPVEHIWLGTDDLPHDLQESFLPADRKALSHLFVSILKLSLALGEVVKTHYCPTGPRPSTLRIEADAEKITSHRPDCYRYGDHHDATVRRYAGFAQVHYEASIIVLYRSYLLSNPEDLASSEIPKWNHSMREKVKDAADHTSAVLNNLVSWGLVRHLESTIITVMKPAMHVYLLFSSSSSPLSRRHASYQLDLYMLVLDELRDYSWSAGLNLDLFRKALGRLAQHNAAETNNNHSGARNTTTRPQLRRLLEDAGHDPSDDNLDRTPGPALDAPDHMVFEPFSEWTDASVYSGWEFSIDSLFDVEALM